MFIQIEVTPNPESLKFLPGRDVTGGVSVDCPNEEAAQISPLAFRLFGISGVEGVFLGEDFITVTRHKDESWDTLKPEILSAIMDHFLSNLPILNVSTGSPHHSGGHTPHTGSDGPLVSRICEILDTRIRPAVARDGGDITFRHYEDGVVFLTLRGACSGCPSSTMTLKQGVEALLRRYIPEIKEVRPAV